MSLVYVEASVSLDGFIADASGAVGDLFDWYHEGDVEVPTADDSPPLRTGPESAGYLRDMMSTTGAIVVGRRRYETSGGWGGTHPLGRPVVVVTHEPPADPPRGDTGFRFVDGVGPALDAALELAEGRAVGVAAGDVGAQALRLGRVEELRLHLVPVVLGGGVAFLAGAPPSAWGEARIIEGDGVTHLVYRRRG